LRPEKLGTPTHPAKSAAIMAEMPPTRNGKLVMRQSPAHLPVSQRPAGGNLSVHGHLSLTIP
jgi:hypothetical protein